MHPAGHSRDCLRIIGWRPLRARGFALRTHLAPAHGCKNVAGREEGERDEMGARVAPAGSLIKVRVFDPLATETQLPDPFWIPSTLAARRYSPPVLQFVNLGDASRSFVRSEFPFLPV
jgi:hypothetical protein